MKRLHRIVSAVLLAMLIALAGPASAQTVKHSGLIVSIAEDGATFVLSEVGPWEVRDGATVTTRRTIALTPETRFAIVVRADETPSGFPRDFVEIPVTRDRVFLNDWVTVEARREGGRLLAEKVTVVGTQ